jgi:hypothetical protein
MKPIVFSRHALDRMLRRGVTRAEVEATIREGEIAPAKKGRLAFRKNFPFESDWKGKYYDIKQVMPIVAEEHSQFAVITVYAFYFGGKP